MLESVKGVGAASVNSETPAGGTGGQNGDSGVVIDFSNGDKGNGITIQVTEGMTLSELAVKYDTTVEDIMAANGTSVKDIYIGQDLVIPKGSASESVIAKRKHNARMSAEEKEIKDKGLTDPVEIAQYFMNKDLKSGRLKWIPEEKGFLNLFTIGGYYEYYPEDEGLFGVETYGEIKSRYNLEDGAIRDHNYIPGGGNYDIAEVYDSRIRLYPADMPIPK